MGCFCFCDEEGDASPAAPPSAVYETDVVVHETESRVADDSVALYRAWRFRMRLPASRPSRRGRLTRAPLQGPVHGAARAVHRRRCRRRLGGRTREDDARVARGAPRRHGVRGRHGRPPAQLWLVEARRPRARAPPRRRTQGRHEAQEEEAATRKGPRRRGGRKRRSRRFQRRPRRPGVARGRRVRVLL
ncbi:hypothetical protein M885DRAFT_508568 [Pelagophyceae sp. CCMP2097]|nr:hypothetical protein M885DRAFT_508568 [Pelagophyceae sp. CCMP2097]